MKPTSPLLAVLLTACAIPTFSAPIPTSSNDCLTYGSCRPSRRPQWRNKAQIRPAPALQEPHFPPHQLMPGGDSDEVEVKVIYNVIGDPRAATPPEPRVQNPKLDAVLKAAHRDRAAARKDMKWMIYQPNTAPTNGLPVMPPSHISKMSEADVELLSHNTEKTSKFWWWIGKPAEVHISNPLSDLEDGSRVSGLTITCTYGFGYVRAAYTDVVVVSIVVLFMLMVVLVELFDKIIDTSRALLHLNEGAIRLEECDCKSANRLGLRSPEPSILIAESMLRRASIPQLKRLESVEEEKILITESDTA